MRVPTGGAVIALAVALGISARQPAAAAFPDDGQGKKQAAPAAAPKPKADYGKYDFALRTLEGDTIRLSDYAGKVVLVNLWAPWCGPCKVEMPGFSRLYEKYRAQGFEIISVAVQTNESAVRAFIDKTPLTWPVGINEDVAVKYGTYGLPDNYLFLPDGMMTRHFVGFTKEEALEPLVKAGLAKIPAK